MGWREGSVGEVRGMWAKRRTIGSLCGRSEVEYTLNGTRTVSLARGMDPRHPTDMHVTGCRASRGCAPASWGGIIHHMSSAFACCDLGKPGLIMAIRCKCRCIRTRTTGTDIGIGPGTTKIEIILVTRWAPRDMFDHAVRTAPCWVIMEFGSLSDETAF